ncbi:MAG: hypothetical protein WC824_15425 [Bacteroidota bacterium]
MDAIEYGEIVPGWTLIRAKRDGLEMKTDQWGLVWQNGPSFIWTPDPKEDPCEGRSEDEIDNFTTEQDAETEIFMDLAETFMTEIRHSQGADFRMIERLVLSCREAGWDESCETIELWLFSRMGRVIQK